MADLPITQWIRGTRAGDPESEAALWGHYFKIVVRLARSRMFALQGSIYDEEDAAASALHSVFRGIKSGGFPDLHDRNNLWRVVVLITKRKLRAQWRRETTARRSGQATSPDEPPLHIEEVICDEPTPDFVTELMDETECLLEKLDDDQQRRITVMKLDGFTNDEIAEQLKCSSRSVRRKLERIRNVWHRAEEK